MKKRLTCLFFALLMCLMPFVLSACSDETDKETADESERDEIYLTFYAITDSKTNEEGLKRTQEAINEVLVDRFKTHLVLKLYTADEYQAALDEQYAEFERIDAEEAERAAKIASGEIVEEESPEEDPEAEIAEEEVEKTPEELEEEARTGPQIDILYIDGAEKYYDYINKGWLLPLDSYIKLDYKILQDYLCQNLLTSAKVSGTDEEAATYGIPNNVAVADEGWYYVFDTALAEKHGFDLNINPPQLSVFASYADEIAATEPGVIPVANPAPANGVDFLGDMPGFPISVNNSEYGYFEARGVSQTYGANSALRRHFETMAHFRSSGYFADRPMTTSDRFFMDLRAGTSEDAALWESQGYTVITYRRPTAENARSLSGLYGISSRTAEDYADRAMEILSYFYTNAAFHNLLTYGVQGTNYEVNEDGRTVRLIRDDYVMDFNRSGNTILGYFPEGFAADYKDRMTALNRASKLSGFSSFYLALDEDEQEWFDQFLQQKARYQSEYEALWHGVSDWEARCDTLNTQLDALDLEGFITDVLADKYKEAAKEIRSADKNNYLTDQVYYLDELERRIEEGEMIEIPASDTADAAAGDLAGQDTGTVES